MITLRRAADRGAHRIDWLDSRHTFSFGHYHDPEHMGFGALRVINEDQVQPGKGFDTHGHRDMEIISYVLDGALEHADSMGNGSVIRPGDVQRMSAGTGVRHSEHNPSPSDPVHFLQIWVLPERNALEPGYEQRHFTDEDKRGRLRLIGSRDGRAGSVTIHQDVDLHAARLDQGQRVAHPLAWSRRAWLQVARGEVALDGAPLGAGDGAAIEAVDTITIEGGADGSEVLLFDLA